MDCSILVAPEGVTPLTVVAYTFAFVVGDIGFEFDNKKALLTGDETIDELVAVIDCCSGCWFFACDGFAVFALAVLSEEF